MNHKLLADLCAASYKDYTFKEGDVEVLHEETKTHHVYAIRGTEMSDFFSGRGWMDVIRDIAIWPKSIKGTYGHAGFVHGWHEIEDRVIRDYYYRKQGSPKVKPMILTGHSLGGAIAVVGAYKLKLEHAVPLDECVTFGAPPAIDFDEVEKDRQVAERVESITTQYVHVSDHVPNTLWYTRYDHVMPVLVGGKFRRPFFMRNKHGIEHYQDVMGM